MRISDWSSDVCSSDLFDQPLQTVVPVDHAAIEVVQVRRRETAAVERHQRTQFGRDDRNDVQHHPLRTVAGFEEAFDNLQPLDDLLRLQLRLGRGQFFEELYLLALQVEFLKQLAYGFSADAGGEGVLAMLVLRFHQLVFVEKLELGERRQAGFDDDIVFKIEDALKVLQRHVQQQANARRQRLQEIGRAHV